MSLLYARVYINHEVDVSIVLDHFARSLKCERLLKAVKKLPPTILGRTRMNLKLNCQLQKIPPEERCRACRAAYYSKKLCAVLDEEAG